MNSEAAAGTQTEKKHHAPVEFGEARRKTPGELLL
jgi:hypothetical protein